LNLDPCHLSLPASRIIDVSHCHPAHSWPCFGEESTAVLGFELRASCSTA
jgi:hypothetical protein